MVHNNLSLYIGSFLIPSVCFIGNILIRSCKNVLQSSGADLLLLLIIFDLNVLIDTGLFITLVKDPVIMDNMSAIFAGLVCIEFIIWPLCILLLESKIRPNSLTKVEANISWIWKSCWVLSWAIILGLTVSHVFIFTINNLQL